MSDTLTRCVICGGSISPERQRDQIATCEACLYDFGPYLVQALNPATTTKRYYYRTKSGVTHAFNRASLCGAWLSCWIQDDDGLERWQVRLDEIMEVWQGGK